MTAQRERRIINGVVILCLVAGFAFFTLIAWPNQFFKAGLRPNPQKLGVPKLSSILPPEAPGGGTSPLPENRPTITTIPFERSETLALKEEGRTTHSDQAYEEREDQDQTGMSLYSLLATKVFPRSSLANGEPSILDSARGMRKNRWLAVPEGLETDVAFWHDVYAKYDNNQVLLHHPRHLGIVYEIVDLSDIERDPRLNDMEREHLREKRVEDRRELILDTVSKLATNPPSSSLTLKEWQIKNLLLSSGERDIFKKTAEDEEIRAQEGLRDRFQDALKLAGRYLGEIESIFALYGLPREITRLVFVESMFDPMAESSAGAAGLWQFTQGTGKRYLKINQIVDERRDPVAATHAAAKLLLRNYEELRSWPLAINAYNCGLKRMRMAVKKLGTRNIGRIIQEFEHPSYGFASRNFFLEFLAALDVAEHAHRHFGTPRYDPPLRYETVRSGYHISLPDVARLARISMEDITDLNPSLGPEVKKGQRLLPMGFAVKVPEKRGEIFLAAAARAPKSKSGPLKHRARKGETLASIARMYGVTLSSLRRANRRVGRRPRPGQSIVIPFESPVASPLTP